jgi:hypothetical protein
MLIIKFLLTPDLKKTATGGKKMAKIIKTILFIKFPRNILLAL